MHKLTASVILGIVFLSSNCDGRRTNSNRCYFGRSHYGSFPRTDCGWPGVNQNTCESMDCCFDDIYSTTYNCFHKDNESFHPRPPVTTQRPRPYGSLGDWKTGYAEDCNYAGCTKTNYGALGDLKVDNDPQRHSTFGAKTHSYWNHLGGGVGADAHLAHVTHGNDWAGIEANVGKVGASASAGVDGIGAKLTATLAEAEGKIGKGPLSIGGKVGLSGDTGISIGPKTELKVLGTGVTISNQNGLELCLLGSCFYIG